jgi:hypothetical protein
MSEKKKLSWITASKRPLAAKLWQGATDFFEGRALWKPDA